MQLPNWLKVLWWLTITGALTYFLHARLPDLLSGKAAASDIAVFGVWMALLLAPLFSEVSLLGVTLKNEIEELKGAISTQLTDIRTEVRSAVDVRATISPQFHMPAPVTDAQLPQLEERVKSAVESALASQGIRAAPAEQPLAVEGDVSFLFATRYNIEKELRRLAAGRILVSDTRRVIPTFKLVQTLISSELVEPNLGHAIREVYAVCSPAIHGEEVTPAQINFVRDVGPQLVATLKAIQ
jgi:hypothetical protein